MGILCSAPCCYWCPCIPCCGYRPERNLKLHPLENWFERVAKNNPGLRLIDVAMVSSHDSGTYTIPKSTCCSAVSTNHHIDLYEQLKAGARYLDYRYGPGVPRYPANIHIYHGIHKGGNYCDELEGVLKFTQEHPNEFIFLDLNHELWLGLDEKQYLSEFVSKKFGHLTVKKEDADTWFKIDRVTVGEVLARYNKRMLVIADDEFFNDLENLPTATLQKRGLFKQSDMVLSYWPDKHKVHELIDYNYELLLNMQEASRFSVTQYITTPETTKKRILSYICGISRLRVDQRTYLLHRNKDLHRAIRDAAHLRSLRMVMLDFFNFEPFICHFLIGLNFADKLRIHKAEVVKGNAVINVLDEVRKLVRRKNSLWISDFKRDLAIPFAFGKFLIVFNFIPSEHSSYMDSPEVLRFEEFNFGPTSQYLLNGLRGYLDGSTFLSTAGEKIEKIGSASSSESREVLAVKSFLYQSKFIIST